MFRPAAKLVAVVLVPVACVNLWFGSNFGILVTELQPMKISAAEALWETRSRRRSRSSRSAGSRRATRRRASLSQIPGLLSFLSTGSFDGKVVGPEPSSTAVRADVRPRHYVPPVEAIYWSMRGMAYLGSAVALVAVIGAFLYWRRG